MPTHGSRILFLNKSLNTKSSTITSFYNLSRANENYLNLNPNGLKLTRYVCPFSEKRDTWQT